MTLTCSGFKASSEPGRAAEGDVHCTLRLPRSGVGGGQVDDPYTAGGQVHGLVSRRELFEADRDVGRCCPADGCRQGQPEGISPCFTLSSKGGKVDGTHRQSGQTVDLGTRPGHIEGLCSGVTSAPRGQSRGRVDKADFHRQGGQFTLAT